MKSNELPETQNGLVTVSDFYAHQHESMRYAPASYETALKNTEIPHQIKFHPFDPDALWKQAAFRVYVAPEHLQAATDLCMSMRYAPASYEFARK